MLDPSPPRFPMTNRGPSRSMPRKSLFRRESNLARPRRALWLALILTVIVHHQAAAQQVDLIARTTIGFDDHGQVGQWTPVRVEFTEPRADAIVSVQIPDGDGQPTWYRESNPDPNSLVRYVYVKPGRRQGPIRIRVATAEGETISEHAMQIDQMPLRLHPSTRQLVLCLFTAIHPQPLDLEPTLRQVNRDADKRPIAVNVYDAELLPDAWYGYAGVDRILLTTYDNPLLKQLTERQREALRMWVRLGGRLTISVGEAAEDVDNPLAAIADLLPGKPTEVVTQQRAVGLEKFVIQTSQPLQPYKIALFEANDARVLASERSLTGRERPVIMQHSYGLGVVTTVATDLDVEPMLGWESLPQILLQVLALDEERANAGEGRQGNALGRVSHIGYDDLAGQLRGLLDRFQGPDGATVMVAFSPVAACIALYILLIAPGDYFFLRRFIGRMELTWITFPLMVILACGAVLWASGRYKAERLAINQFDVVDYDQATGTMRGHTWASIYSPETTSYDLQIQPRLDLTLQEGGGEPLREGRMMSWMGLPGRGLGGMNTTTSSAFREPYAIEFGEQQVAAVQGMPIAISSTKQVEGLWWRTRVDGGEPNLVRKREYLQGEFTNPFSVEIRDGLLFYNDWVYALRRRVLPRQTVSIAEMDEPRDLVWRLTRRRVVDAKNASSYENTPWDPSNESPGRMMEMMSLYQLAGGQLYTQLSHRYFDHVDVSHHLANGRAVFIGRVEAPLADIVQDGSPLASNPRRYGFCRAILTVKEEAGP